MLSANLSTTFEFRSVPFFGRSFAEYVRFFSLDPIALRGSSVLDVAAGPSSFTADACQRHIEAVAVDPLYGCPVEALGVHVQLDYADMRVRMLRHADRFRFHAFPSLSDADRDRTEAARIFLRDYREHFVHGRYLGGMLPHLPVPDASYDLVLCAHLVFTHAHLLGEGFLLAACRELVRVARGEVRIHPLCGPDGRPHPALEHLRSALKAEGIASDVRVIDYEFFPGTNSMLILKRI